MQENNSSNNQLTQVDTDNSNSDKNEATPHKHNPFEDKKDHLTKEEEAEIEQFKEAQTERD